MTIDEGGVGYCMRLLADGSNGVPKIIAGESAVAGLTALIGAGPLKNISADLGLDYDSKVLVIGAERDTDPELYQSIINNQIQNNSN